MKIAIEATIIEFQRIMVNWHLQLLYLDKWGERSIREVTLELAPEGVRSLEKVEVGYSFHRQS